MKLLKVVGLLFIIGQCQAFYFLSEADYNQGVERAKTHSLSDCVGIVAVYDNKLNGYVYGTATALSPTVIMTAAHLFEGRGHELSRTRIGLYGVWHRVKRQEFCPKTIKLSQFFPDDLAILELESPLSLSHFPTLTFSEPVTTAGISIGYGSSGWSGGTETRHIDKTSTPVSYVTDQNGCYRQEFCTSALEGTTCLHGFKQLSQPESTLFAVGMPGDSGAPVFDDTGNLVALYTHNLWHRARDKGVYKPNENFCDLYCPITLSNDWLKATLTEFGLSPLAKPDGSPKTQTLAFLGELSSKLETAGLQST